MSDLNWCTFCDNAISSFSNSLYCSEECLKADALNHHPMLGYDWQELKDFPRSSTPALSPGLSSTKSSPSLSPVPSYMLPSPGLKHTDSISRSTFHHTLSPPALELEPQLSGKPQTHQQRLYFQKFDEQHAKPFATHTHSRVITSSPHRSIFFI